MEQTLQQRMSECARLTEAAMEQFLPPCEGLSRRLTEAMRYSVEAGGKRIRPFLVLEFCRVCGGRVDDALPFACAVEFVHTYSLIHDDLPCMDNDPVRRGKPSCHVRYGEATALLAGDALLSLAFEAALCNNYRSRVKPENVIRAARELAAASGARGMAGGQQIDLEYAGRPAGSDVLDTMNAGKTGAMIRCAARMGCYVAGADEERCSAADAYAEKVGLAFQIRDDILDQTGSAARLGKPVGQDSENGKSTYATVFGAEKSERRVRELTAQAVSCLGPFGGEGRLLAEFARFAAEREH